MSHKRHSIHSLFLLCFHSRSWVLDAKTFEGISQKWGLERNPASSIPSKPLAYLLRLVCHGRHSLRIDLSFVPCPSLSFAPRIKANTHSTWHLVASGISWIQIPQILRIDDLFVPFEYYFTGIHIIHLIVGKLWTWKNSLQMTTKSDVRHHRIFSKIQQACSEPFPFFGDTRILVYSSEEFPKKEVALRLSSDVQCA